MIAEYNAHYLETLLDCTCLLVRNKVDKHELINSKSVILA